MLILKHFPTTPGPAPDKKRWLCVAAVIMYVLIIVFYLLAFIALLCNIIFGWSSTLEPAKQALVLVAVGLVIQTVSKIAWQFAFKGVNPTKEYASLVRLSFMSMTYVGTAVFITYMGNCVLFWIEDFWSLRIMIIILGILLPLSFLTRIKLDQE